MGKTVYVNGSIIVQTKFFLPKDMGCGYQTAPEGAEIIEASEEVDGVRCLLIDDKHPQSLFKEYYAKGDISTGFLASSYLTASYLDNINLYKKRIGEICDVIQKVSDWDEQSQSLVYKMAYVNILTALDAFVCYVLLNRATKDEKLFMSLMNSLANKTKKDLWKKQKDEVKEGEWEQDAIRYVLETSFINTDKIDKAIRQVDLKRLVYNRKETEMFFRTRHLIVHRNGHQSDDNDISVTYDLLDGLINVCHNLVGAIFDSVCLTLAEEMKNKPKERDIEEIFPGGRVRVPFKLSDLSRMLRSHVELKEFEPIQLPTLRREDNSSENGAVSNLAQVVSS